MSGLFNETDLNRLRLEANCSRHGEVVYTTSPKSFHPTYALRMEDGDVYTHEYDDTLWVWYGTSWTGPFADLDTAMMTARLLTAGAC